MKKILVIFVMLLNSSVYSQEPVSFTDPGNIWYEALSYPNASFEYPSFVETVTNVYGFRGGDTLIAGETWKRLYRSRNENFSSGFCFECFLREQDGYVFYKKADQDSDTLYNFNILPGEQVEYPGFLSTEFLTVTEIDSIEIGGVFHKRIFFEDLLIMGSYEEVWIEGIGSVHGPVNPYSPMTFSEEDPYDKDLTCFENVAGYYWTNPEYSQCYISIILSSGNSLQVNTLNAYPNPANNSITLECPGISQSDCEIEVMDLTGSMIISKSFRAGNPLIIDVNGLSPGAWFIRLVTKNETFVVKVIKI